MTVFIEGCAKYVSVFSFKSGDTIVFHDSILRHGVRHYRVPLHKPASCTRLRLSDLGSPDRVLSALN